MPFDPFQRGTRAGSAAYPSALSSSSSHVTTLKIIVRMNLSKLQLAALLVSTLVCSCKSSEIRQETPLPFHVALIPAAVVSAEATPEVEDAVALKDTKLAFTSEQVTARIRASLAENCVTKVSILDFPEGVSHEQFFAQSALAQEEHWENEVRRLKPDLVAKMNLSYSPTVLSDTNSKFFPNLLLFLIGGPFCYAYDDRDYYSAARLSVWLYDGSQIDAQQASMNGREAELIEVTPRVDVSDLDFIDRADGVGHYALSLLIPAGWLAKDSDKVKTSLEAEIIDRLALDLNTRIRLRSNQLTRASRLYDFYIREEKVRVVAAANGGYEMRGDVLLEVDRGTEDMDAFTFEIGGKAVPSSFGTESIDLSEGAGTVVSYPFIIPLEGNEIPREVRVVFRDASQNSRERSFTFNPKAMEAAYRPGS